MSDTDARNQTADEEDPQDRMVYTIIGQREGDDTRYELVRYEYDTISGRTLITMQTHAGRYATEQTLDDYMAEALTAIAEYRLRDFEQNEYDNLEIASFVPDFRRRAAALLDDIASIAHSLHALAVYELDDQQTIDLLDKLADTAEDASLYIETTAGAGEVGR